MTTLAMRIPERLSAQMAVFPNAFPQLFVHEGARQALERRLTALYPGPVNLSITDNRHAIITHSEKGGALRARVHHMFLGAPPSVANALVRYLIQDDKDASLLIGRYIDENGGRLARRTRRSSLTPRGKHHNLLALFDELNETYFDGSVHALVTWGKRTSRKNAKRSTIKLGSYCAQERLVRIHPSLDRPWVPRYFVAYVLFHEMLHHVMPVSRGAGRRVLHPPEFREREQEFRFHERALAWEKKNLSRLLRS